MGKAKDQPLGNEYVRVLKRLVRVRGLETLYAIQGREVPEWEEEDGAYADATHIISVRKDLKKLADPNTAIVVRVRLNKSRVPGCIEDWFLITKNGVTKSYSYYSGWSKMKPEWGDTDKYSYLSENETLWIVKEDPLPKLPHKPVPIFD